MENTKKQFALEQIAPYFKNPELCGFDEGLDSCVYKDDGGKMCVAGKNMLPEFRDENAKREECIEDILFNNPQEEVFIEDSVGVLGNEEWQHLQNIHDAIAIKGNPTEVIMRKVNCSLLFSYDELVEFSNNLTS